MPQSVVLTLQEETLLTRRCIALVVFDTIQSLPQEVLCVWRRKWGTVTVLYLCIRYGTVLNMSLRVYEKFNLLTTIPVRNSIILLNSLLTKGQRYSFLLLPFAK